MKRVFILCMLLLQVMVGHAQLQATLNVDSNPTPELSEWVNRNDLAILTVTNPVAGTNIDYQIKVSLLLDGDVKLTTDNTVPFMVADFGTETFLADELIPYNAVQFIDTSFRDQVTRTGLLPPGSYSFCVELLDGFGESLTRPEQICRPMIITDYQMPELLDPVDNRSIDPILINSIIFKWTPLAPMPDVRSGLVYLIAVSEVQPGQTPSQAFSVNYPIIEEEVSFGTQFTWPTDIEAPDEDQQYVWGIKPMTDNGSTYRAQNNGFVDYGVFTIRGTENGGVTTRSNEQSIINCNVNSNDLNDQLFITESSSESVIDLHGISAMQNMYWLNAAGTIDPTKYQLITSIDWGCSHPMEMIPFNTSSKSHDYNNINDNSIIPADIKVSMELRPITAGLTPCSIEVIKVIDSSTREINQLCEFPSQRDFEGAVNFVATGSNTDPLNISLSDVGAFTSQLEQELRSGSNTATFRTELLINYDNGLHYNPIIATNGQAMIVDHTYTVNCITGNDYPTEVCFTYTVEKNLNGERTICEQTYCLQLPDETIIALDQLVNPESAMDEESDTNPNAGLGDSCECLNGNSISIDDLEIRSNISVSNSDMYTLYIPNAQITLQNIIDCKTTQVIFDGMENMDGHPEYNLQSQFFTGSISYDWQTTDVNDNSDNIQTYDLTDTANIPIPTSIAVTFHIVNTYANINCYFTQYVPVPAAPYSSIIDDGECECEITDVTKPIIDIQQLEPNTYPRRLTITNVTELRDYLLNCKTAYGLNDDDYTIETSINWGGDHDEEPITGNDAFEHEYGIASHEIPETICVTYTLVPGEGVEGEECVKEFCVTIPSNLSDLNQSDTPTESIAVGETIHAGLAHEFEVLVTEVVVDSTNNLTGKGTVEVGWLGSRVAVHFNQITIDANKNLLTGKILGEIYEAPAPVYPQAWGEEILGNGLGGNAAAAVVEDWANPIVSDVVDWANDTAGDAVDWVNNTAGTSINSPQIGSTPQIDAQTTPVKLPLGVNYANGDQFAITEMVFRPNLSEFNMVAAKNTPPSWQGPGEEPQLIGFIARNIKFHPTSVETPPERLELLEDVEVGNMNNKITFKFISPASNPQGGCYIEWDENGFSQFGIELESTFTRDWLVPVPDDGSSRTTATFQAIVQDWNDMVLTGNLDECEIVDSQGMTISAGNISFDMSDTLNPNNLQAASDFPSNYTGENTVLFRGFHMEQLTVGMPTSWQTNNNGVPQLSIYDMIINDTGITLVAEAENVAGFRGANVADLIASIDTVRVDIRSSSFHDAYVKGRIGLPVSKADSIQNPLQYKALFTTATTPSSFQLTIEPTGPINANLMKGTMELKPTSNIVAWVDRNKKTFDIDLNGTFVWDDVKLGPVKNVNMELGFQGIEMSYDSSLSSEKFKFEPGTWAFASPQKMLSNFPVTISNIDFETKSNSGNQLIHGDLTFDVIFNLTEDIGGQTKMAVELAIEDNPGGTGTEKFKPKYLSTGINAISIYAHLPAVSIDGTLEFRNDDPVYGNGFKGTLEASFKTPSIGISALAEFGNTSYLNNGTTYRYWRIEAAAKFSPGLPFLPGLAFNGFGGGAYKNMEGTLEPSSGNIPAHYTFSPKKGNLGFKVEATIANSASPDSFNADIGLNGQFSQSQGLINIGFTGDFYIGGPITPQSERDEAQVKGSVIADYNFPDKHFTLNVDANVNTENIYTPNPANLNVDINGTTNLWHFKFGQPSALNTVNVFGISLYEYLTFGNNIETPDGFTPIFKNGWAGVFNGDQPGIPVTSGVDSNSALGKGFAFGIGFQFEKNINKNVVGNYDINLDLAAGAEINLSMMKKLGVNCADSSKEFGLNGWRARGSLGFYASIDAYVSKNSDRWDLLNIKAGGWLDGKFPGPTYVIGEVRASVKIGGITKRVHNIQGDCNKCRANGNHVKTLHSGSHGGRPRKRLSCEHWETIYLVNRSFQSNFEWGTDCNGSAPTPTETFDQEDAAGDQAQRLITYIHPDPPTVTYNFPVDQPIAVKFGLSPEDEFDVGEQQDTGAVVNRTFKLDREVKLYIDAQGDNNFVEIPRASIYGGNASPTGLIKHDNNLGEELYVIGTVTVQNLNAAANGNIALIATPGNTAGNSNNGYVSGSTSQVANMSMATMGSTGLNTGAFTSNTLASTLNAPAVMYPAPPSSSGPAVTPPPPGGSSGPANYGTLPPAAPPVVNELQVDKTYKIIVIATLKEKINNSWVNATDSNGNAVTETKEKTVRTGPMQAVDLTAGAINTRLNVVEPSSGGNTGNNPNPPASMFTRSRATAVNGNVLAGNRAMRSRN